MNKMNKILLFAFAILGIAFAYASPDMSGVIETGITSLVATEMIDATGIVLTSIATLPAWFTMKGDVKIFQRISVEEAMKLEDADHIQYSEALDKHMDDTLTQMKANSVSKEDMDKFRNEIKETLDAQYKTQLEIMKTQGEALKMLNSQPTEQMKSVEAQLYKFIEDNIEEIQKVYKNGSGSLDFTAKVVGNITTASGTYPVAAPDITGTQMAPLQPINMRDAWVLPLTSNFNTNQAAYAYTEAEPKDGDYTFISEGDTKAQIDLLWKTRFAEPVEIAAWERISNQSIKDVANLQSVATDYLRKKHDLKKQNGILFGDGIAPNPKGATVYGRTFVAGSMALKVATPTIMDVINACITDVYTTHNYVDEMSYQPSLVVMNPVDFYLEFVAPKTLDGLPLFPTASLFNQVNIGGITVRPERDIPAGKILVADMSKYNTTNYVGYTVKFGWINDDFIKNQFVMLGESRFHAFVKNFDEQAFIYDDIATVRAAILEP